jgi:hypothetical protein
MLPLFSKVAVIAAVVLALVAAPAPATAAVVAYRVDFYSFWACYVLDTYDENVTSALVTDVAGVFNTTESAVTIKDRIILPGTCQNLSVVFTVEGGSDAPFLASPLEAQAPWTTAFNQILYAFYLTSSEKREAAAAESITLYYSAYITKVERIGSPGILPKRRYMELTLHGKHLATASAQVTWPTSLGADLADAFGIFNYVGDHLSLTASASGGVNNSTLSVRFYVKPLLNVEVNRTTFFATNGTASWLSRCQSLHTAAAAQDLGIPMVDGRVGAALDAVPESESSLTVTGTGYAPGDQSYTDAPTNAPGSVTNAPGDAASAVTTAAAFIAATALLTAMSFM